MILGNPNNSAILFVMCMVSLLDKLCSMDIAFLDKCPRFLYLKYPGLFIAIWVIPSKLTAMDSDPPVQIIWPLNIALPQRPSEKLWPKPPWTHGWETSSMWIPSCVAKSRYNLSLIGQTSGDLCVPFLVSLVEYFHSYQFFIMIRWKLSFLELSFCINLHGYTLRVLGRVLPSKWSSYCPKAKSLSSI